MSNTEKSKAMKLANWGSGLAFAGLVLSPLFSIPGIILGIMAFRARTESEKTGWDGSSVNNRALTAIIVGIISTFLFVWFIKNPPSF